MNHWFKIHTEYLSQEAKGLSNNPNYKQLFLCRNNLLVSQGNIIVRLDTITRFPFLIVYPEASPFALPLFFPLKRGLTEEEVKAISLLKQYEVRKHIGNYIRWFYEYRHQNTSGNLCILEWDNLDDGEKFYGITTLLNRVKDWCRGTLTGEFPPDSQEVEFTAHFNQVAEDLHFLYPESFLRPHLVQGIAYGSLYSNNHGVQSHTQHYNYIGSLITGSNAAGIQMPIGGTFPPIFTDVGIFNELKIIEQSGVIKRLIDEKRLLKIFWFQIDKEPAPFLSLKQLTQIIGDGNLETGRSRLIKICLEEIKIKPDQFFVALRFPNRKQIQEFQVIKITKTSQDQGVLIGQSDEAIFDFLVDAYEGITAVASVHFSDENFHFRNKGRASRNILSQKVINLLGVGALGSEAGDCLVKAGIGILNLFDNQLLKIENSVRHLVGYDNAGIFKVISVKHALTFHNPFIQVNAFPSDVFDLNFHEDFMENAIGISTIADDNVEAYVNEKAVLADKPVYYVRALRGGKIARIFRVIPGKDACFHCLELYRKQKEIFISIPQDPDQPTLRNECNNPIRPGSAADLKIISSLVSRIVIDELEKGFGEANHWIWSTEKLDLLLPFHLQMQTIPIHRNCVYCNNHKKLSVSVPSKVMDFMKALVAEDPTIETGGVLTGHLDDGGNIQITHASGPGPQAIRSATRFEKDIAFCQKFLDNITGESRSKIFYLGEWHSHPSQNTMPSHTDLKSLSQIASQKEYLTEKPVMIILSNIGDPSCSIHPSEKRYYFANLTIKKE
jgi:integrative and conjugative element protein (TIGR02256 family)